MSVIENIGVALIYFGLFALLTGVAAFVWADLIRNWKEHRRKK